ncbi:hypothetical protein OGAPHI_005982 [Ogataea philodendri]|uniref:Uncharacterized protein n=1 Tax=Ogataea philodendri TaxID=1378263 RepID=A0A9P8T136_9ASCO|nr:uncharacterized protein OGAPHI_005982 [Ogataea philodendri]KAH3661804.1 hypothetical protein OGAPHI_005982 [Ogataea philodendri]
MPSTSTAVGCAVGIPAALVVLFIGFWLLRQHLNSKKEEKLAEEEFQQPNEGKADGDYLDSVPVLEDIGYIKHLNRDSRFREETVRDSPSTSTIV